MKEFKMMAITTDTPAEAEIKSRTRFVRRFSLLILACFALLFALNKIGAEYFLYYYWWWYDIPMHLFGGFAVALLAAYILFVRGGQSESGFRGRSKTAGEISLAIILSVLAIGVLWEMYEFAIDRLITLRDFDPPDTGADIINDLIGASFGAWVFTRFFSNPKKKEENTGVPR